MLRPLRAIPFPHASSIWSCGRNCQILRIVYLSARGLGIVERAGVRVEVLRVPRMVPVAVSGGCLRASTRTALSSGLVAIVDDEGGLVHVEVRRRRRIVQVVVCVQRGRVLRVVRLVQLLVALAQRLGRALERLLDLLLALLIQEGLKLRVRRLMGRLLGLLKLLQLVLRHCAASFLLHLFVLRQQFLLEVLVLGLRLVAVWPRA